MSNKFSFYVLIGLIVAFGFLAYKLMGEFFVPLFLAVVLVIVFWPLQQWFVRLCRGRERIAAALSTAVVSLMVLLPAVGVIALAAAEGLALVGRYDKEAARGQLKKLRESFGVDAPYMQDLRKIEAAFHSLPTPGETPTGRPVATVVAEIGGRVQKLQLDVEKSDARAPQVSTVPLTTAIASLQKAQFGTPEYEKALPLATGEFHEYRQALLGGPFLAWLKEVANPTDQEMARLVTHAKSTVSSSLLSFSGKTGSLLLHWIIGLVILVTATYFFFAEGPAMNEAIMQLIPFDEGYKHELLNEFDRTSRAVVIATLVAAAVQGLAAGLAYYFAFGGLGTVFLLTLLATVCGLIPFVGPPLIFAPACLYLFFVEDRTVAAVIMAIYGVVVVAGVDNVVKPWVLHGQSKLHPLLALLSVLGGVEVLGPIGLLVGPMVVAFLQTLLSILQRELLKLEQAAVVPSD